MATLQVGPTRQCHTEYFSGILTDPLLTLAHPQEGGRDGKKTKHKMTANSNLMQQHFAKNCVQATAYKSHKGAPAKGIRPPLVELGKMADQHYIEVNFA